MSEPCVLLSVDYESWVTLRLDHSTVSTDQRKVDDNGYVVNYLDEFLDVFNGTQISIYLSGEVAEWYPEIPGRIAMAGHELGFHGLGHRFIKDADDLRGDFSNSVGWLRQYNVTGFRAPIVSMPLSAYSVLAEAGFKYSSSVYAPTGSLKKISGIWEVPLSTYQMIHKEPVWWWPRSLSMRLLVQGELPYSSSIFTGLLGDGILFWVEKELRSGRSPVLVIHNYQITPPNGWIKLIRDSLFIDPRRLPYIRNCTRMVRKIIDRFPVGTLANWLDGVLD